MFGQKGPARVLLLLFAVSLAALAGCESHGERAKAGAGAPGPRSTTASSDLSALRQPELPAPLRVIRGIACRRSSNRIQMCTTDAYDISGSDVACSDEDSSFGSVLAEGGVDLLGGIERGSALAHLAPNQLVCIHYLAESRTGGDSWSYVTAIPSSFSTACNTGSCREADAPARWIGTPPTGSCVEQASGRYAAACPSGWVPSAALDAYSMGLSGQEQNSP
jgi:hypothetical protein